MCVRYHLEEGGELLGDAALGGLVPQGDLLHRVLEELGHLQLHAQLLLQTLLLHRPPPPPHGYHDSIVYLLPLNVHTYCMFYVLALAVL